MWRGWSDAGKPGDGGEQLGEVAPLGGSRMLPGSFASGRVFLSMSMLCARSLRYWGTGYFRTLSAARSDGVFLSWSRFHPQPA